MERGNYKKKEMRKHLKRKEERQMTKNRTKKTKRTIKRSDRFLRVKNKSEVVYRVPVFLKKSVGMLFLSESGTLETDGRLSRAYVVDNNRIEVI